MIQYEFKCRDCGYEWLEEYTAEDCPRGGLQCFDCGGKDTYRCVTTAAAVHFKGPGWSPDGYNKQKPLEKWGKRLTLYDRKEDRDRVLRGEAEQNELQKLNKRVQCLEEKLR